MKYLTMVLGLNLGLVFVTYGQNNKNVWSLNAENYEIVLNFEEKIFRVDTFVTVEGHIYLFTFSDDSSYFRVNYISPNAKFECCEDTVYQETQSTSNGEITDRKGYVVGSNLHWREVKNSELEIIYNYCPGKKLEYCDTIMNSVVEQLSKIKK